MTFLCVKNFINVDYVIQDAHSAAAQNRTQDLVIWKPNKVYDKERSVLLLIRELSKDKHEWEALSGEIGRESRNTNYVAFI